MIRKLRLYAIWVAVLSTPVTGWGQNVKGTFTGTVRDVSEAPVPGAAVTVMSLETNVKYQATTDAAGTYVVPFLDPGRYSIAAERQGFKIVVQPEVKLDVAATVRVDLTLQVGNASQKVEVVGTVPWSNPTPAM